jgi:hypothetical protein
MGWSEFFAIEQPVDRATRRIHFAAQLSLQIQTLARERFWHWL